MASWDWKALSSNPNITWIIVEANPDKPWDLSSNNFKKDKEMFELRVKHQKFVQEHIFEEFVTNRIQKLLNIDKLDDVL